MNHFQFAHPALLWLLLLLPALAFLRGRRGPVAAVEYSNAEAVRQVARETRSRAGNWLTLLRLLAAAFFIVALARPQFTHGTQEIQASGVDLALAIDISGSMQSLDFKEDDKPISRVDIVKSVVKKFIDARPDDRMGLVAFAGAPYLVSPLTLDHDWLQHNLERVKIGLVQDGTAIGSGIAMCVNRLRDQPSKSKIIVLLTDGQNNCGKISPLMAAEAAKTMGVKIYTIGAGIRGEAPMPVKDRFGQTHIVMEKCDVDEETLGKIAEETGGKFFRATDTESLRHIYDEIDKMEKTTRTIKKFEHYTEAFQWALLPGFLVLGLGLTLERTRFRRLP